MVPAFVHVWVPGQPVSTEHAITVEVKELIYELNITL